VVLLVGAVDCVVEGEVAAVVVVVSKREQPERAREAASAATTERTATALLVDFTMAPYLLCALRVFGITPDACFNKPGP
jgi:hypothetical protein